MAIGFVNSLGLNFPLTGAFGGTGINNGANTLTVTANSSINQDVRTTASPSFVQATAGNFLAGYRTQATAAGTTVLVASDAYQQYFTGITTQTVTLPLTSTMVLGQQFLIVNNSTGVVTVQSSGGNTIQAMDGGTQMWVTVILTSGTTAASWNAAYSDNTAGVASVSGTVNRITVTGTSAVTVDIAATYVGQATITTLGTITTGVWNGTAVDVAHGGTGATTFTAYSPIFAGTTSTGVMQSIAIGSAGQVLTSNGPGGLASFQTSSALVYSNQTGAAFTASPGFVYGAQNAAQVTATMGISANFSVGQTVAIEGYGAAGFVIQLVGAQVINAYGGRNTTAGGTVTTSDNLNTTSSAPGCAITLRYVAVDTFQMISDIGNFVFA